MMIRGFRTISSRAALAATAGMLMGVYASAPAHAADLAGGCCADLEERVAELEVTTARKGNRVVSLQIYGQVNKALLFWDDGEDSDAYVVDHDGSGTRIGFVGSAALRPGWKAGFLVELDVQDAASDKVDNGGSAAAVFDDPADEILVRYSNVYIESERLGRVTLGQGSSATDGVNEVVLGNSIRNSDLHVGNNFFTRDSSGAVVGFSSLQLKELAANFDGGRDDVIRYDSPSIAGFIFSASWGDDDYSDVALRYKGEWNSVRVAAAVGYQWDNTGDASTTVGSILNDDFTVLSGSISVMHIPTGLYAALAAGEKELDDLDRSASFWYVQLGIEKKFISYGSTTLYAEYGSYDDVAAISETGFASSETDRWGVGIVQKFDSAALELYAQATFWDFEATTTLGVEQELEGLSTIMLGSRLKF
jgi:predicted porin